MSILIVALTGMLTACSFPLRFGAVSITGGGWLAWISFVPLLIVLARARWQRAALLTFGAAAIYFGLSLCWLYIPLQRFGSVPAWAAVGIVVLLVLLQAAFAGIAGGLARWLSLRLESDALWIFPTVWTALAWTRGLIPLGGFPWAHLAMGQTGYLPLIQIVDLVGIWGLIFLILWVNQWMARAWVLWRLGEWEWLTTENLATVLLVCATCTYGGWQISRYQIRQSTWLPYVIALVQPNVSQTEKLLPRRAQQKLAAVRERLADLPRHGVDLVIWPETAHPTPLRPLQRSIPTEHLGLPSDMEDPPHSLIGALTWGDAVSRGTILNSAWAVDGEGRVEGIYHKWRLVPFGEYVPGPSILRQWQPIAVSRHRMVAGSSLAPLSVRGIALGTLICYEDIFPRLARMSTVAGAELLAVLTNDAWYGQSSGPVQHLALAIFRAVENRRYLVRAANTGISAVVDPVGRVVAQTPLNASALLVSRVGLGEGITWYTRWGDWFAYACVAGLLLAIGYATRERIV